ncbi:MAG: hypothetical protein HEQ39_11810 [Rhizobacter sp.]
MPPTKTNSPREWIENGDVSRNYSPKIGTTKVKNVKKEMRCLQAAGGDSMAQNVQKMSFPLFGGYGQGQFK